LTYSIFRITLPAVSGDEPPVDFTGQKPGNLLPKLIGNQPQPFRIVDLKKRMVGRDVFAGNGRP